MNKNVTTITDAEFDTEVIQASQFVLVYFWANWCGPCKLMSPLLDATARNYSDHLKIVKMEVDPNPETVKKYQVEGVPALRLVKAGELLVSIEGVIGKEKLINILEQHLKNN